MQGMWEMLERYGFGKHLHEAVDVFKNGPKKEPARVVISIPMEAIEAAMRILDPDPTKPYGKLTMGGDRKVYEQFYKDVQLLAETVAKLVVGEEEENAERKP
jgi:hypothetical protein